MNTVRWSAQILAAIMFLMSGSMKLLQPKEKLAEKMGWADDFNPSTIKIIAVLEILGSLGLIIPAVTGVLTIITPLAAAGLALTMLGAMRTHIRRHEYHMLIINGFLLALTIFIAWGRLFRLPF